MPSIKNLYDNKNGSRIPNGTFYYENSGEKG